ncbi:hypothetical protein, partial [Pseudoalteromonas fuliginea]|uniref:hypothetical protein n=1 Tax=Pseudoalteromonas fuliginea TaxID=1872678 RepID=UPI00197ED755
MAKSQKTSIKPRLVADTGYRKCAYPLLELPEIIPLKTKAHSARKKTLEKSDYARKGNYSFHAANAQNVYLNVPSTGQLVADTK